MSQVNDLWLSLEEVANRGSYLSEPRLRWLVQKKLILFKKVDYLEGLIEFSAKEIIKGGKTVELIREDYKSLRFFNGIELNHTEPVDEKFTTFADRFNYLFQVDRNFDENFVQKINFKKVLYTINENKRLDHRINYKEKLEYLNCISFVGQNDDELLKEYINNLKEIERKIFVRLLLDLEKDNVFESPFKNIATKFGEIIKDDFNRSPNEKGQRNVKKTLISKEGISDYLNYHKDISPVLSNFNFIEELNRDSEIKWIQTNEWEIRAQKKVVYRDNENPFKAETIAIGNIVWQPDFEKVPGWPEKIIKSLNAVHGNPKVQLMTFFPKSFMKSNSFKRLRLYLYDKTKMKAVFYLKSIELKLDSTLILYTPILSDYVPIFYSEVDSFNTLSILVRNILKGEGVNFRLKTSDGIWTPEQ